MIAHELTVTGSHGMAAADYPELMALVADGRLDPGRLVTRRAGLDALAGALAAAPEPGGILVGLP